MPKRAGTTSDDAPKRPKVAGHINVHAIRTISGEKGWTVHVPTPSSRIDNSRAHVVIQLRVKPHQRVVYWAKANHTHLIKIVQDAQHADQGTYNQNINEGAYKWKDGKDWDDHDVCVMRMSSHAGTVCISGGCVTIVDPQMVRLMGREHITPDIGDVLRSSEHASDVVTWLHGSSSSFYRGAVIEPRITKDENVFWKWADEIKHLRPKEETSDEETV